VARQRRDTPAHRAIATSGWILVAAGLVGLILWSDLIVVWAFMIFFGVAALARALIEWPRARRGR
jgi:hypothetical protein